CGAYVLSVMAISTVTGCAAVATVAVASRYSTASLRSGEGLLSFSRITMRPATRPTCERAAGMAACPPSASSVTGPADTRIANSPEYFASKGVELTVVLPNPPGADSDAGLAFARSHRTATGIAPAPAPAPGGQAHDRIYRDRADERFL